MTDPIRVEVRRQALPQPSTNPEMPGLVHWVFDEKERVLYCSPAAFDRLQRLPPEQRDQLVLAMGATA